MSEKTPFNIVNVSLAKLLRELRELIKDVWYRNDQDRREGELNLLKKRLRLQKELPSHQDSVIVVQIRPTQEPNVSIEPQIAQQSKSIAIPQVEHDDSAQHSKLLSAKGEILRRLPPTERTE